MNNIICPHCGQSVEINLAIKQQIEEAIRKDEAKKNSEKLQKLKEELETKAQEKAKKEIEIRIKDAENETKEKDSKIEKLIQDLLKANEDTRLLRQKDRERELELQKRLEKEEEKIREDAQKRAEEEQRLKLLEKDKQLQDLLKTNEEMRRKLQQGSQQTQGEVFEIAFQELIESQYPNDKIEPVRKGIRGGDVIQEVWDSTGNFVGKILWELKNTKQWNEQWVDKLKNDRRVIHADEAVLISEILPNNIKNAGFRNGIWVTQQTFAIPLADTLRAKLIQMFYVRNSVKGKDEKMEILFRYLSGTEFRHRIEAIVEAFTNMQEEIEKEKRYFANKWARDEKNIRQVIDNTYGMHGDLKGIMGAVIPHIKGLDKPALGDGETEV